MKGKGFPFLALPLLLGRALAVPPSSHDAKWALTKTLGGASGSGNVAGGKSTLAFSWGEPAARGKMSGGAYLLVSGYHAGAFVEASRFRLLSIQTGTRLRQGHLPVGVPLGASLTLTFSQALSPDLEPGALQVRAVQNHRGQAVRQLIPFLLGTAGESTEVVLSPASPWSGNTLYEISLSTALRSVEGNSLAEASQFQFLTALDPSQDNTVLSPPDAAAAAARTNAPALPYGGAPLRLEFPSGSLPGFAAVLSQEDPLHSPAWVDPSAIREANRKIAEESGGARVPVALREIAAVNLQGQVIHALGCPVTLIWSEASVSSGGPFPPTRTGSSLGLWRLDEAHRLWVKLPDRTGEPSGTDLTAALTHFSVFALMTQPSQSVAEVLPFPVPWRPHGPQAGEGPGQTGTDAGGITFTHLPADCTLAIFTLTGEKVRAWHHSDLTETPGQSRWDGRTSSGHWAASGVYLWRVQSAGDVKRGKLLIIR